MIGPNKAFAIIAFLYPDLEFTGDCVDYDGFWGFPYNSKSYMSSNRVFMDQSSGIVIPNDPSFDVERWNASKNYKDSIQFEKIKRIQSIAKCLNR